MARFEARRNSTCALRTCRIWIPQLEQEQQRFQGHRFAEVLPGYVTQTLLARRTLFDTVGLFDTSKRVGDPMDWFLRAAEHGAALSCYPTCWFFSACTRTIFGRAWHASHDRFHAQRHSGGCESVFDRRGPNGKVVRSLKFRPHPDGEKNSKAMQYDVEADWVLLTTCNFRCYCFVPLPDLASKLSTHGNMISGPKI